VKGRSCGSRNVFQTPSLAIAELGIGE
jgi:hypothetical protein